MEISRPKSEKIEPRSPQRHEQSVKKTNKNMVTISKNRNKLSPSPEHIKQFVISTNKKLTSQQKSIISQEIRVKGQEKLLYLRQSHIKKLTAEEIFKKYPFTNIQCFIFNDQQLRNQNGQLKASVIQDQNGIHLVEEYGQILSQSKYKSIEQEQEEKFNGLSISIFNDGIIYQGNYHNGKYCGFGYELHPNGNTFIGTFKEGVKQGDGTYYWFSNNQMYSGQWHGGLPHGIGIYISKDKYEGSFSNGLKYGFGEEIFANGDRYIGEYINSVAEGYGEYYWADGSIYKGDFKQGVRHGYGIWQDQKQQYKGSYRMDKKQGFGIYKWKHKQVFKGSFRDDYRQGYGQFFSLNKQEKQKLTYKGCWTKGKKWEEGVADEAKIKQLYVFLNQSHKIDELIEGNRKKQQPKVKVGHKNCIPHDHSREHSPQNK